MANLWAEEVEAISTKIKIDLVYPFILKNRNNRKGKEKILDELKFIYRKYLKKNFVETPQTKFRL